MKKNIYKFAGALIAASMIFSSMNVTSFADDAQWIKGFTGSEKSKDFAFSNESSNGVTIENTKVNNGKFSDGEDSFIYYAQELAGDVDFEFKATVNIDKYNMGEEASNPQQGSIGIAVIDELYNKTDDKKFTDGIFLGAYAKDKKSDMSICPMIRANSDTKEIGESLSETFSNSGENLGKFDLTIKKSGNIYTFICGEKSYTYEMNSFEDKIYPCLYVARNAVASFSNVSLNIDTRKITNLILNDDYKNTYYYGEKIDKESFKVTAEYDNGTTEEIDDFTLKGFNSTKSGKQTIYISKGNAKIPVSVTVKNRTISELKINYAPAKSTYYLGTPFSSEGISITAKYDDETEKQLDNTAFSLKINGKNLKDRDILTDAGVKTVSVIPKSQKGINSSTISTSFNIEVKDETLKCAEIKELPVKTVYYLGDKCDLTGIRTSLVYTDDFSELTDISNFDISGFDSSAVGKKTIVLTYKYNKDIKAQFDIDVKEKQPLSLVIIDYPATTVNIGDSFDESTMKVGVKYSNGEIIETNDYTVDKSEFNSQTEGITNVTLIPNDSSISPFTLNISVKKASDHKWRKAIFGQSASTEKEATKDAGVTAENYGTTDGKINVKAWEATGKITADHDGIVYYYTKVDANNNFEISADITVNKYLEHNNDDTKRNGQEAFGIMARDVVPFLDKDGNLTTDYNNAQKDDEGIAITREKSAVFASNTVCVGGFSGTGWPNDASSPTYEAKTKLNRINLFGRTGVTAPDGGGKKIGPLAVSSSFPKEGNKYKITLKKVNGGFSAICYDYQSGETMYADTSAEDALTIQSKDNMYVGFFASRWAEIDVENVYFNETDKATSPVLDIKEEKVETPAFEIISPSYSKTTNYSIKLRPTSCSGTAVVKLNNSVVAQDIEINGDTEIPVKLKEDFENEITVAFTPDDKLSLSSYDKIILRGNVVHRNFNKTLKNVYVSSDGSALADGTENSPYDIDTAIGFIEPGQTIVLKEGVYHRTKPIEIELGNDGTSSAYKTITAEEGKKVVFDLGKQSAGAVVTGNYWKFNGIEFKNSGDNLKCFHLGGSNCIIENCIFHDNADMGLQISRTYSTDDRSKWPSNNLVLNCESYNNCDPSKINADGFGAKLTVGNGNMFKNCLSHHNVDDGWDLYTKVNSGAIGEVTLENCVSYRNGYKLLADGTEEPYGAGGHNGFKCGGENVAVNHKLINCIAFGNNSNGVTTNSNPNLTLENVVSFDNNNANIRLYSDKPAEYNYTLNNVYTNNCAKDESDVIGSINKDTNYKNNSQSSIISDNNYLQLEIGGKSLNAKNEEMTSEKIREKANEIISANGIKLDWKF